MALGGGAFTAQNKVLPGSYINFVSVANASATLSDRGIAALPLELDWGPEGKMFTVGQGDFQKGSTAIFGYPYGADEMRPVREIFCHAKTVHFYNLRKGGKKASAEGGGLKVTARHPGSRGNAIRYAVTEDGGGTFGVSVYMGAAEVSSYRGLKSADGLFGADDPYVTFSSPIEDAPAGNAVRLVLPGDGDDLLGMKADALQEGIGIVTDGNTAYVSGTLKYVTGYDGFSSDPAERKGNYFAVRIDPDEPYSRWHLQKRGGTKKEIEGKDSDHGDFAICRVGPGETFEIGLDGGTKLVSLDFSRCSFEQPDGAEPLRQGEPLSATAGVPLTGGMSGEADEGAYQGFLDQAESYTFNAVGCMASDGPTKKLFADYCRRMREDVGKKFQAVLFGELSDYEGVVSVKNGLEGDAGSPALVPWVTGVIAGTAVNRSATNMAYDGEYAVDTSYTQAALEEGIREGSFMLHSVDGAVNVLEDINTFVSVTDEKSGDFSNNQTVRVLDQIANDIAVLFGSKYVGRVPNDAAGRVSLWNDIVRHHEQLQAIRAIEDFSGDDVTVEQGAAKRAVVVTDRVTPVSAMEQLYMTVYVE